VSAEGYCLYLLRVPDGAVFHLEKFRIQIRRLRVPSGVAQLRDTRIDVQTPQHDGVVRISRRAVKPAVA
jgi:hypothetical protein